VSAAPRECVVDASVGVKLVVPEELSAQADSLFALLEQQPLAHFCVPDLFFIECANVLLKYVRRLKYPTYEAQQDIIQLTALNLDQRPAVSLSADAFELARQFELSAYDACYVVLAKQLDCPLVTADERLVRKFVNTDYKVVWLGDLDLESSEQE